MILLNIQIQAFHLETLFPRNTLATNSYEILFNDLSTIFDKIVHKNWISANYNQFNNINPFHRKIHATSQLHTTRPKNKFTFNECKITQSASQLHTLIIAQKERGKKPSLNSIVPVVPGATTSARKVNYARLKPRATLAPQAFSYSPGASGLLLPSYPEHHNRVL